MGTRRGRRLLEAQASAHPANEAAGESPSSFRQRKGARVPDTRPSTSNLLSACFGPYLPAGRSVESIRIGSVEGVAPWEGELCSADEP